jgi:hypothetical protein
VIVQAVLRSENLARCWIACSGRFALEATCVLKRENRTNSLFTLTIC